jgi:DNA-binding MarR family transcriptional regulator
LRTQLSPTTDPLAVWLGLLRGHAGTTRAVSARLMAEHGLTINDYEALLLLAGAENCSLRRTDLASRLVLTASGVTRLLDGLERSGFVARATCASDARVTYAVLTDAGRDKLDQASCSHLDAIRALFRERFSDEEMETFGSLLQRLPGAAVACSGAEVRPAAAART